MRLICLVVLGLLTCSQGAVAQAVIGAGSAFAAPIYTKWAQEARASTGVDLNYQAVGSGAGQNQILQGLIDFGASDVPMDANRLEQGNILQFPTVVGGVVVFVNLPGIAANAMRLSGPVVAQIFIGEITKWNDPRIAKLNPELTLPDSAIVPCHHDAASGTTYALARYLAKVSDGWKTGMGVGMVLNWPVGGVGVRGSYGAASTVMRITGSIAYAENSYVSKNHLTTVQLSNATERFVSPGPESFAAAAASADWDKAQNFAIDLTLAPGEQSWPIVTATYVLVPRSREKAASSALVLKVFRWAFEHGDAAAEALQYVSLPNHVRAEILKTWPGTDLPTTDLPN